MKTKTVSARIIGQSYSGNLSQGDKVGAEPSASRYDSNAFQLFQTPHESQADQDKDTRLAGCDSHWWHCRPSATLSWLSLHLDATQTTASSVLQTKIGRAHLVTLYIHLCKSLRTPSSSSSSSFVVSFSWAKSRRLPVFSGTSTSFNLLRKPFLWITPLMSPFLGSNRGKEWNL